MMHFPPQLVTVTPLSKLLALLLFISMPFAGFAVGVSYQRTLDTITMQGVSLAVTSPPTQSPSAAPSPTAESPQDIVMPPSDSLEGVYLWDISDADRTWLHKQYADLEAEIKRVVNGSSPSKCDGRAPGAYYVCYPMCRGAASQKPAPYTWQTVDQILSPCS